VVNGYRILTHWHSVHDSLDELPAEILNPLNKTPKETFTNYVAPKESKNIPEVVSVKGNVIEVTNKPETIPNKPESPKTFVEEVKEMDKTPVKTKPEQLLYAPTAEQYYKNEYYYPFNPLPRNEVWQPYNINFYEDRGNSEDRVLQNPTLNDIYSYEYLVQNRQY